MLPKLNNDRNHGLGEERHATGDAHFARHTMSNGCISLELLKHEHSSRILHEYHVWDGPDNDGEGRWKLKPRPDEYVELFDEAFSRMHSLFAVPWTSLRRPGVLQDLQNPSLERIRSH